MSHAVDLFGNGEEKLMLCIYVYMSTYTYIHSSPVNALVVVARCLFGTSRSETALKREKMKMTS